MISKELKLLIESIKIILLDSSASVFKNLAADATLDWKKVDKMLIYHSIRPLFYEACKKINFRNDVVERAGIFSKKQAIRNQNDIRESIRVLNIFKTASLPGLPYKGLFFLERIYQNKPLREIGDFDILVQPGDAVKALQLLIEDGYTLCVAGKTSESFLQEIIKTTPNPEVGLDKKTSAGINVHIDFHWGINVAPQYRIDLPAIFYTSEISNFQGNKVLLPNASSTFKMLLNHHGGRECWVRLKDMADLIAFKKSYPGFTDNDLLELSAQMDMKKIYQAAHSLLESVFWAEALSIDQKPEAVSLKRIIGMWEYATFWDKIIPKVFLLRIYRRLQDQRTTWGSLIYDQIIFHSKANLTENMRLFVLQEKYVLLNAFSKLLSYLIRVYVKPPRITK